MRRALLLCAAIAFAIACGDNVTEPIPDRTQTVPPPAFATSASDDGTLSITTDKDDYAPGDTVHFTGTGWTAGNVLNVVLVDDAVTQETHSWTVTVGEDGTFHDSSYVVDTDDIGVTFTLTATDAATGQSLTVVFTDGNFKYTTSPANLVASIVLTQRAGTTCPGGMNQGSVTASYNVNVALNTSSHYVFSLPTVAGYTYSGYTTNNNNITVSPASDPSNNSLCVVSTASGAGAMELLYLDNTTTELGHNPAAATNVGENVTFTATVKDHLGNPIGNKGSVTFYEFTGTQTCDALGGATALAGPTDLSNNPSGQASFQTSALTAGTHTITACYGGTENYRKSFGSVIHIVNATAVATTTSVTSSQNPSSSAESVTFTATVTSGSPATAVTTGQISFKAGGTNCADAPTVLPAAQTVSGSRQVAFTTSALALGSHTIRGCYGGATGFLASEGSVTQQVNNTATLTEIASSINPSVTGQSVTFTATVKQDGSTIGAHGSVSFRQGSTDCTDGTQVKAPTVLNGSGQATYTASFLASESPFNIRACYGGATGFDPSNAAISQAVNKANTTTVVTTSKTPTVYSEPVTFNVTVSASSPGSGTPGGNVTLKDGSCAAAVIAGPSALDVSGKVSFTGITSLSAATHTIAACYGGSGDFEGSTGTVTQVVDQAATTTTVVSSDDQSVYSQSVNFTATVAAEAAATLSPDGTVTFHDGASCSDPQIGAAKTLASGVATSDATTSLSVGTHTITACYAGNNNFKASNGNVTQIVDKASTTTVVTTSGSPSILHQPVTFTAVVTANAPATATPVGNVTFHDGSTCSATQIGGTKSLSGGSATSDAATNLAAGNHTIKGCYEGNANFNPSDGSVAQQVHYVFDGLYAPVDRPNTMNVSRAGQGVPLKWRLTDYNGAPVLDFAPAALGVAVSGMTCDVAGSLDQIEEYAGNSGLQNLGDGYYQYNWKTPGSYANTCRQIGLNLGEGFTRGPVANFSFKK
jgi:hypothetical protein